MARPIPPAAPVTTAVRFTSFIRAAMSYASPRVPLETRTAKRHRAVVHSAEPRSRKIEGIDLGQPPGLLRALLRQDRTGPLDIPRGQADGWFLYDGRIAPARHAPGIASCI